MKKTQVKIDRKAALKKLGTYGKYAALTSLATYLILSPQKVQAVSPSDPVGGGFDI